jgi:hypothetical protein
MLKNGRALEPPRESRMTTMMNPSGGNFFQRLRHAQSHPACDTLKSLPL